MALYAFDGTWQGDVVPNTPDKTDTNIVRFFDAYQGKKSYMEGIGLRKGVFGKFIGLITGAGGRTRILEALEQLDKYMAEGDQTVDIIGFSRGAALALHFANQIKPRYPNANIRFVGLWDTVASFGIPGNLINLGWQLTLADGVQHCYHAMALDERRSVFPLTRIRRKRNQTIAEERLQEVWFRGVHADIGSWGNPPLNSISLCWLLNRAVTDGLPIDTDKIAAYQKQIRPDAPISQNTGHKISSRKILSGDKVHQSVKARGTISGIEHNDPPPPPAVVIVDD
ncbi:MAG: DUF2235 domain-containing protein [Leptolyngbya sp. SIO3F4]|nr:DUF2235 domain-containing protein [Leptolyngbya sp. SIO3F4]